MGIFFDFFLSLNSKIMGANMTMDFYGQKIYLCMECTQMNKLNSWYTCIFFMMYHCYQTHYKMHNNINTHIHVKKKNNVVCRFHYPLSFMHETKILKPFQINENYPFSQQYVHTKENKIFQNLKYLK